MSASTFRSVLQTAEGRRCFWVCVGEGDTGCLLLAAGIVGSALDDGQRHETRVDLSLGIGR